MILLLLLLLLDVQCLHRCRYLPETARGTSMVADLKEKAKASLWCRVWGLGFGV